MLKADELVKEQNARGSLRGEGMRAPKKVVGALRRERRSGSHSPQGDRTAVANNDRGTKSQKPEMSGKKPRRGK